MAPFASAQMVLDTTIAECGRVQLNADSAERYIWTPTNGLSRTDIPNPVLLLQTAQPIASQAMCWDLIWWLMATLRQAIPDFSQIMAIRAALFQKRNIM